MVKGKQQNKKQFDKNRELGYIGVWFGIVIGTATLLKALNVETSLVVFVIIIIILLITII